LHGGKRTVMLKGAGRCPVTIEEAAMSDTADRTVLPSRDRVAEDGFIAAWRDGSDEEAELLLELVTAAVEARRPMLAARLVGLLDDDVGGDDPSVMRARAAARMLLRTPERVDPALLEDFLGAWRRSRKVYMDRVRRRHRARQGQKRPRQPRRR